MQQSPINLYDLLEQVNSKETFLRFASALSADFQDQQENGPSQPVAYLGVIWGDYLWHNHSVDAFLEQMCAWAKATSIITNETMLPEQPSWHSFAKMLLAGKEYE